MKPRDFFPNMPDLAFNSWLAPEIEAKGWPFSSIGDNLQDTDWKYILGLDYSLADWFSSSWKIIPIKLSESKFTGDSMTGIQGVVGYAGYGTQTKMACLEGARQRFRACTAFFKEHGNIPVPIIVTSYNGAFTLWDGNHRLASVIHCKYPLNLEIPAWLVTMQPNKKLHLTAQNARGK